MSAKLESCAASARSAAETPSTGSTSVACRLPRVIVPVLSSSKVSTSPAASTARPDMASSGWPTATSTGRRRSSAALANYFRVGNLTALRELALLWLADKVDEQLDRYRSDHGIGETWEARERVVVGLTGGPEGETLIRRAARIAARTRGADLLAVHVARSDGLFDADPTLLAGQRLLVESLGGTYHEVAGTDVPTALLDFARAVNATQIVLGASRRGGFAQLFSPGVGVTTTARSGAIDVHLVTR